MGFSSIMNPQYAALRALGIPAGHHDATRFVYFWAPPNLGKSVSAANSSVRPRADHFVADYYAATRIGQCAV
jgi:hypothetical protein